MYETGDAGDSSSPQGNQKQGKDHFGHDTAVHPEGEGPFGVSVEITGAMLYIHCSQLPSFTRVRGSPSLHR